MFGCYDTHMDEITRLSVLPPLLNEIPDPPKELWVRGSLPAYDTRWLAVVGSRKYSAYGKDACEYLIEGLRGYPITIVSGLALGIDAIAHQAALSAGLACVGVPGSGLSWDVVYPRSNVHLARKIVESGGALVSEFAPHTVAAPWTFPQRNRIMAGLSHAVLLIEAHAQSGTLITARLASDYNRDVLVVPGSIFSDQSTGVHQFLKLGATPITHPDDIIRALNLEQKEKTLPLLTGDHARVYELLSTPQERDHILKILARAPHEGLTLLTEMEIAGLIEISGTHIRRA